MNCFKQVWELTLQKITGIISPGYFYEQILPEQSEQLEQQVSQATFPCFF